MPNTSNEINVSDDYDTSIEGLKPGDVIFFKHTDAQFTHKIIRLGNKIFGLTSKQDQPYVHTEICVGIDKTSGKALIAGATAAEGVNNVRITFLESKLRTGMADGIRIHRPTDPTYGLAAATAAKKMDEKLYDQSTSKSTYSKSGCIRTIIPAVFGPKSTSKTAKAMFCSEFVSNALQNAFLYTLEEKQNQFKQIAQRGIVVAARITPGKLTKQLTRSNHFLTAEVNITHTLSTTNNYIGYSSLIKETDFHKKIKITENLNSLSDIKDRIANNYINITNTLNILKENLLNSAHKRLETLGKILSDLSPQQPANQASDATNSSELGVVDTTNNTQPPTISKIKHKK